MKLYTTLAIFGIVILGITSCSPKVKPVVIKETPPVTLPVEVEKDYNPNCATFRDISSSDRDEAETAYVLYKDELKLNNYIEAKTLWKKAFYIAPAANGRVKYQYDDGIKIYQELYKASKDDKLRQGYIDTIMSIYDRRLECLKDTSYIMGRKAYDYYYTYPGTKTDDELFGIMTKALDKSGEKADYFIINPLTQLLIEQYKDKKIDKATAKKYTFKILDAVEYGKKHCKRDCDAWDIVGDYAPVRLEAFEALTDFYDCDYYVEHYYHEFESAPTDCDVINRTYAKLRRGNCGTDNPKLNNLTTARAKHCKVKTVAKAGPCRTGYDSYTNGEYKEAIASFESCSSSMSDNNKKAKYNLLIAKIYYRDLKNYPKARKYALKAAKLRSNWGEPYMLIGRLYASSGPLCGPGRGFKSQRVVWPALDKWNKAKKIDPSVTSAANKLIHTYSQYMPSREDLHQRTISAGSSYKVGCWINETTKVRAAGG